MRGNRIAAASLILAFGLLGLPSCGSGNLTTEDCQKTLDQWNRSHPEQAEIILSKYQERLDRIGDMLINAGDDQTKRDQAIKKLAAAYLDMSQEAYRAAGAPRLCAQLAAEDMEKRLRKSLPNFPAPEENK